MNMPSCAGHWEDVSGEGETRFETEPEATRSMQLFQSSDIQNCTWRVQFPFMLSQDGSTLPSGINYTVQYL